MEVEEVGATGRRGAINMDRESASQRRGAINIEISKAADDPTDQIDEWDFDQLLDQWDMDIEAQKELQ